MKNLVKICCFIFFLVPWIFFACYSYTQTDPNLTLFSHPVYQQFQEAMWQIGYHQRQLSVFIYGSIMCGIFSSYVFAVTRYSKKEKHLYLFSVIVLLLVSYPALSHDVFNYLFNAKMALVYHLNPHTHVALEVPTDLWLRFMHNTHTPAPYGYGWTMLSYIPFLLGFGKLLPSLFFMRIFMIGGFAILFVLLKKLFFFGKKLVRIDQHENTWFWWFALNPLILIETISTIHNDVWMMVFGVAALVFVRTIQQRAHIHISKKIGFIALSIVSLLFSISIKYVTVVLVPIYLCFLFFIFWRKSILNKKMRIIQNIQTYWADISAVLLFLPLLTARSQQFHPWYLFWSLSLLSCMKIQKLQLWLLAFSVSSMFRYIPYLAVGLYTSDVLLQQTLITWVGGFIVFFMLCIVQHVYGVMTFSRGKIFR